MHFISNPCDACPFTKNGIIIDAKVKRVNAELSKHGGVFFTLSSDSLGVKLMLRYVHLIHHELIKCAV